MGDHRAVLLIAVVPTVIQLVADQRAQTQAIPIGAVEFALFEGIRGRYISFLHTAPSHALPAAADAAMDANRPTLTGPSHGRWGEGGWPRGRGGACQSHCHLSSSTAHVLG